MSTQAGFRLKGIDRNALLFFLKPNAVGIGLVMPDEFRQQRADIVIVLPTGFGFLSDLTETGCRKTPPPVGRG